jgi:outer membrane protease
MRTITVFSFFVIILYVFLVVPALPAETNASPSFPYTFSVGASTGFLYGEGEEIVYKSEDNDAYLSHLLWDLKPLFYYGSSLLFAQRDPWEGFGFFSELLLKFGLPRKTGGMEDRDWLSETTSDLTHFSSHDNYTDGAFILDFSAGLSFPLNIGPLLKIFTGLSFMNFKWTARDGYYQYAKSSAGTYEVWDESIEKKPVYGPAITYCQEWLIFIMGSSLYIPFFTYFSLGFSFQLGAVIFCNAQDDHLEAGNKKQYNDYVFRGVMIEPRGELVFSPHSRVSLSLYCGYRRIKGGRGESYARQSGTGGDGFFDKTPFDSAGAAYAALDTGLALKVQF